MMNIRWMYYAIAGVAIVTSSAGSVVAQDMEIAAPPQADFERAQPEIQAPPEADYEQARPELQQAPPADVEQANPELDDGDDDVE